MPIPNFKERMFCSLTQEFFDPSVDSNKTAIILAGGASRRFGRDKAWALWEGKPLIEILIDRLKQLGFEMMLSGSNPRLKEWGLPVVEDACPLQGPLQALKGIWEKNSASRILLVACDMPFIEPDVIQTLWSAATDSDILILEGEGSPSPLPGVYRRTTYPFVESLLKKGRRDLKALWSEPLKISVISRQLLHILDPVQKSLWNVNTPQDLSILIE